MLRMKGKSKAKLVCYKCNRQSAVGHVALAEENGKLIWQAQSDMPPFGLWPTMQKSRVHWKLGYDDIHYLTPTGEEAKSHFPGAVGVILAVCPECWNK